MVIKRYWSRFFREQRTERTEVSFSAVDTFFEFKVDFLLFFSRFSLWALKPGKRARFIIRTSGRRFRNLCCSFRLAPRPCCVKLIGTKSVILTFRTRNLLFGLEKGQPLVSSTSVLWIDSKSDSSFTESFVSHQGTNFIRGKLVKGFLRISIFEIPFPNSTSRVGECPQNPIWLFFQEDSSEKSQRNSHTQTENWAKLKPISISMRTGRSIYSVVVSLQGFPSLPNVKIRDLWRIISCHCPGSYPS